MAKPKSYHLTINRQPHTLTLAPSSGRDYCFKCHSKKEIKVISERTNPFNYEERKFCGSCALTNLRDLEESAYQLEDKKEVIKELRTALRSNRSKNEPEADYYEWQ